MKILVTGYKGQLGFDVVKELNSRGLNDILALDKEEMDLTSEDSVRSVTMGYRPDIIIHCAAYTAVDLAEDNEVTCFNVNVLGTRYLAQCAKELDATFVYVSTDYVFNGLGETPFVETDQPEPKNVYGRTKYLGEVEVTNSLTKYFITRVSWVFGLNGNNFIKTMLRLGNERKELSVVNDQIGSPTYTVDLAETICDLIETTKYGTYHVTNEGFTSWYDFAKFIFSEAGMNIKVNPTLTSEYKTRAVRPLNSRLSKEKLVASGFKKLRSWEEATIHYLQVLGVKK